MMISDSTKEELRQRIIRTLEAQGFLVNPHIRPNGDTKEVYRSVQKTARLERVSQHKEFLGQHTREAERFLRNGKDIDPQRIELELREVKPNSLEERLFLWWNCIWWSIPYERSYGRQMRFLLWDAVHDSPFGMIGLHSPPLKMSIRDSALGISKESRDWWVNMSMSAQRVGALPPYNELLWGKMVAFALTADEIWEAYKRRYEGRTSLICGRCLPADLLFITTTGAFGKSSLYNRLKYGGETVAEFLGYTQGSGAFHIPDALYADIVGFLGSEGINVERGYGHGPSRKRQLLSRAFRSLGFPSFEYHGVQRGFYLFPLVKNLREVIQNGSSPVWYHRPFDNLVSYWKERWAVPRSQRVSSWQEFRADRFIDNVEKTLEEI